MRRGLALALVLTLVLPALATTGAGEAVNVSIASTAVEPSAPFVGETVIVTLTIRNDEASAGSASIENVTLRTDDGDRLARVEDAGSVQPGASSSVPLAARFREAGVVTLRVVAYVEEADGEVIKLQDRLALRVTDEHPDVRISAPQSAVVGVDREFRVRVDNGLERELRSIDVRVSGPNISFTPSSAGQSRLAGGESMTVTFTGRATVAGRHHIEAVVRYRTSTGYRRTVVARTEMRFEPLEQDVTVLAESPPRGNLSIPVTVANLGNAPLEHVVIRADATNGSVTPVVVGTVPDATTRRVSLQVNGVEGRADVDVTVDYEIGGRTGSVTAAAKVIATGDIPGEVQLTGVDVQREGDRLRISGSASNVGLRVVNSVIVRVRATANVTPAGPNREFFVGTVPASDFVSFDVYAKTTGNVSSVPLEVTYLSDGRRKTVQARVPVDVASAEPADSGGGGSTDLLVVVGGAVIALAVGALIVVGWRNRGR